LLGPSPEWFSLKCTTYYLTAWVVVPSNRQRKKRRKKEGDGKHRRVQELKLGSMVERRRREPSRGAGDAKGMGRGEGVFPSYWRVWKGGTAPPQKCLIFYGQNGAFSCTLGAEFCFFYNQNSIEIHHECMDCHEDRLACDKNRYSKATIPQVLELKVRCCRRREWGAVYIGVNGVQNVEGVFPSPADSCMWESVSSPSRVWGRAPAKNEFGAF